MNDLASVGGAQQVDEPAMTQLDVLCDAYGLLHEHGWAQHVFVDREGCMCASAALEIAVGARPLTFAEDDVMSTELEISRTRQEALDKATETLRTNPPTWAGKVHASSITGANDHSEATFERICAWLEGIISHVAQQ